MSASDTVSDALGAGEALGAEESEVDAFVTLFVELVVALETGEELAGGWLTAVAAAALLLRFK
jgi:hypothetical protein